MSRAAPLEAEVIGEADFEAFFARYGGKGEKVDVVVFSAPQLSLMEMQSLAELLEGVREDDHLEALTEPVQ